MRVRLVPFIIGIVIATMLTLTACGSGNAPGTIPTKTAVPATPTPTIPHVGQSADQLLAGLKAKGLPIGVTVTYTAETDQNKLLGRPNQYTSKVNFKDTRIPDSGNQGVDISVGDGGSIEAFANQADAQKRFQYLQSISSSSSLFAEYEYLDGVAILRLSHQLTPDQAKAYEVAFKSLP